MKQLTKAEEEIMQVLWELEIANVKEVIAMLTEPKPAYNTVSTIIRILESKNFVSHKQEGKWHYYYPLINKEEYSNSSINKLVENYFEGSFNEMVSFFIKKNDVKLSDIESLLKEIKK
jgi:predicted transcriptional regulator